MSHVRGIDCELDDPRPGNVASRRNWIDNRLRLGCAVLGVNAKRKEEDEE
jgi:hypothetical protein